jgi:phosphoglycerate dehydrogenase-like enzyme
VLYQKSEAIMAAIALLDDYQNVALEMADWSGLQKAHRIQAFTEHIAEVEALARALQPFEIIGIMRERTPFGRALLEKLPNLRLLVTTGKRNASIDLDAAKDGKVTVCGTGGSGKSTADLTFGLILSLARHIPQEAERMRRGGWQRTIGFDLNGRTLGIIGLGNLGSHVARIAGAFGMSVIAWSTNLTDDAARERGATRVDKDELFRRADIVTVHSVLSPRTRGLVGAPEIGLMKRTALLINTSRGPIVDEGAVLAALREKRIAGFGADVYDVEPLPADHPLRAEPRALLTPHLGYVTEETYRGFYGGMVETIEAWLAGKPINVLT